MNKKHFIRSGFQKGSAAALILILGLSLTGCGLSDLPLVGRVFSKPVFEIGSESCPQEEAKIILLNYQKEYGNLYGIDLWSENSTHVVDLEQYVKDLTLSQLAEVYTLDIIAKNQEIVLSEDDRANAQEAASVYLSGLNEQERAYIDADEKDVAALYERYALAQILYRSLTENVNQEVSDDEARVMRALHIRVEDADSAAAILKQLKDGVSFAALADSNNTLEEAECSIDRTTYEEAVIRQLFALKNDTWSQPIQMDGAYHIFYCVTSFDPDLTEANKANVLQKRMEDAVSRAYNSYADQMDSEERMDHWNEVTIDTTLKLEGDSFLTVYDNYFGTWEK